MPANGAWPPEIDVIELGESGDFTTARMTTISAPAVPVPTTRRPGAITACHLAPLCTVSVWIGNRAASTSTSTARFVGRSLRRHAHPRVRLAVPAVSASPRSPCMSSRISPSVAAIPAEYWDRRRPLEDDVGLCARLRARQQRLLRFDPLAHRDSFNFDAQSQHVVRAKRGHGNSRRINSQTPPLVLTWTQQALP